jgi:hypothetical protein
VGCALIGLSLSCSADLAPVSADACDEQRDINVGVSGDPVPVFSWTPACGMASLQVFPSTGEPSSGWVLYTGNRASQNPLRPGIRYGQAPPEAVEAAPATLLAPGVEYTVTIFQWLGEAGGPGGLFLRASATFQR